MRKFTALLALIILVGYFFSTPGLTYYVLAAEPFKAEEMGGLTEGTAEKSPDEDEIERREKEIGKVPEEEKKEPEGENGKGTEITADETENAEEIKSETEKEEIEEKIEKAEIEKKETEEEKTTEAAALALRKIVQEHTVIALVYLSDEYPVREEASYGSNEVITVLSGQQVQILDVVPDENGEMWMYVALYYQGIRYEGYIPRVYLACSDELFLEWESAHKQDFSTRTSFMAGRSTVQAYQDVEQFPDSYKGALNALKQTYPNWTFVKMNTNLDWNYVVSEEMKDGRSLIESSFPAYMQDGLYSENWAYASKGALEYYLDPRNGLNETDIFQHELLTYNASYHTQSAVQDFLKNTFMAGTAPKTALTYSHIFWTVGADLKVSPFHLACRVYQEQGKGDSPLISGTYPGYAGYYNFFNIGASGNTDQAVIESGLARAKKEGWSDGYSSIAGGADVISKNYILKGQDTLYLQKFDVDGSYDGMFWHQYMQNICAPSSEGRNIRKLYLNADSLNNTFVFKVPVYNNMPEEACSKPTVSYSVSLAPPAGYADTVIYLDGMGYAGVMRDGKCVVTAPDGNAETAVMYKYNESGVPVGMYVWTLKHNGSVYTAAAVPELQDILSYHGFSIRITGKSGIRFKTGVSAALRSQLAGNGTAGFTLKEYGTLVMNRANMGSYPLIKGGEKVLSGMSYGINAEGMPEDKIYETVSGRHRFTSVLVGLPSNQYKTEYAFRGYIILKKDGREVILYGPPVWRSIYSLAGQVLAGGQYGQGSDADLFLRQLIADADRAE